MTVHAANTPFRSRNAGLNRAKPGWACKACGGMHDIKPDADDRPCWHCGKDAGRWRLASKAEQRRFAELWLSLGLGKIEGLVCQPRFDLKVNGRKVTTYVADFQYRKNGRTVLEDVKPKGFRTDLSKLKISLFNAIFAPQGLEVAIVEK